MKEHDNKICKWLKTWFCWGQWKDFLEFENVRVSPQAKNGCAMLPRICTGSEDNPPHLTTKPNNPPLPVRFFISPSIKVAAGNSVVGNRVSYAWNANKGMNVGVQLWLTFGSTYSCHFWAALPYSAPQKHFKWCGRYFIWRGKALLYVTHKDLIIILSFIQITL